MISLSIRIQAAAAQASLKAIKDASEDKKAMHGGIAESVAKLTREHLQRKYVPRNKRGDFWADVRESITAIANSDKASVTLNELGIGLRYYGGTVTPGKSISSFTGRVTRALAVPSDKVPISGGRQVRPKNAGLLAFIKAATRGGDTVGYLVEGIEKTSKRGKNKGDKYTVPKPGGDLMYTLRKITRHRGDKGILPNRNAISDAAMDAIRLHIANYE